MANVGLAVMRITGALVLLAIVGGVLAGCSGDISASDVKEMDKKREETAKNMPGSNVPKDPADD
jgi:hypothetical protein